MVNVPVNTTGRSGGLSKSYGEERIKTFIYISWSNLLRRTGGLNRHPFRRAPSTLTITYSVKFIPPHFFKDRNNFSYHLLFLSHSVRSFL